MQRYSIEVGGKRYEVNVDEKGGEMYRVVVDGEAFDVRLVAGAETLSIGPLAEIAPADEVIAQPSEIAPEENEVIAPPSATEVSGGMKTEVRAPMPGVVLSVAVQPGERVNVAQQLIVLEAMKMKNPISSTRDGVVSEIMVQAGQSVGYNDLLLKFEEA